MSEFNWDNPRFDLAMELLCLLPVEPDRVSLASVAEDFGLGQNEVIRIVCRLQEQRFGVRIDNDWAWIMQDDAEHCRTAAQRYWDDVYEQVPS